jgi:hypothetical protein
MIKATGSQSSGAVHLSHKATPRVEGLVHLAVELHVLGTTFQLWPVTLAGIPVVEGNVDHFSDLDPIVGGHGSYTKARHLESDVLVFSDTQRFRKGNNYLALKTCSLVPSLKQCGTKQFGFAREVAEKGS